jgi:uncharacterized membrane protein
MKNSRRQGILSGAFAFAIICALGLMVGLGYASCIGLTFTTIDAPGASSALASRISNSGEIVGRYSFAPPDASGKEAANAYTLANGAFSAFSYPGSYLTGASGVKNNGQIVGDCQYEVYGTLGTCQDFYGVAQGWVKTGGTFTNVGFPGAIPNATDALGINDSGQVVGQYELPSGALYGYLLSGGSYSQINPFGSPGGTAYGINNSGQIVGFYCATASCQKNGFVLSGGVYTTLAAPGAYDTIALGINNAGDVVGSFDQSAEGPYSGFI